MPTTIYLARHATPDWKRTDLTYHLPPGPPLSEEGITEAQSLGVLLRSMQVSLIYTSPLERCLRTAELAGEVAGIPVEVVSGLTEWQPGESYDSVAKRMWPTVKTALAYSRHNGTPSLITHGGPIAALLLSMGMDPDTLASHRIYDNNNPLPPAGVWRVTYEDEGDCWDQCLVTSLNNH
jgi:broad specificity phosphatase PhoE